MLIAFNFRIFEKDGAEVVVDPISLDFIEGATIDYKEDMMSASFRIDRNPLAQSSCSCGSSFTKKEN
jgi:iron-sulfur cluster assembly accessory protein